MTQFEIDRVQGWNHAFTRVNAMLKQGARIVMTSRDYIYARARHSLKRSAFPLLEESQVVINVKELTREERQQILYNHIKLGTQKKAFKATIKPWLPGIADHPRFIPETARRLGNAFFTKSLSLSVSTLADFVERQKQILIEVITGLDDHSRAGLALVYMRNGTLDSPIELSKSERVAIERFGSAIGPALTALGNLRGSLVQFVSTANHAIWAFRHPTVRDAFASFILDNPEWLGIYVRGVALPDLMNEVTCGDVEIQNAVRLPSKLFPCLARSAERCFWICSSGGRCGRERPAEEGAGGRWLPSRLKAGRSLLPLR
jgi:hypothetical protein